MEVPVLPNGTVQVIVDGDTKTVVFPHDHSADVKFVGETMRTAYEVTGGILSSSSQQPVVVNTLVAGRSYFFLTLRQKVR